MASIQALEVKFHHRQLQDSLEARAGNHVGFR